MAYTSCHVHTRMINLQSCAGTCVCAFERACVRVCVRSSCACVAVTGAWCVCVVCVCVFVCEHVGACASVHMYVHVGMCVVVYAHMHACDCMSRRFRQ